MAMGPSGLLSFEERRGAVPEGPSRQSLESTPALGSAGPVLKGLSRRALFSQKKTDRDTAPKQQELNESSEDIQMSFGSLTRGSLRFPERRSRKPVARGPSRHSFIVSSSRVEEWAEVVSLALWGVTGGDCGGQKRRQEAPASFPLEKLSLPHGQPLPLLTVPNGKRAILYGRP